MTSPLDAKLRRVRDGRDPLKRAFALRRKSAGGQSEMLVLSQRLGRLALSVAGVVGVATLAACSTSDAGRLVEYPEGAGGVVVIDETSVGEIISIDDIVFCKEGDGVVEIERVELVESNGELTVLAFSVLPAGRDGQNLTHLTSPRQSLAEAGYPTTGPMLVDLRCPANDLKPPEGVAAGYSVLGIEVTRAGDNPGTARGVRMFYSSNGESHEAVYPLGLVLCDDLYPDGPDGATNERCVIEQLSSW